MIAFDLAVRSAAAWLVVGLGLFIAGGSIRALRTPRGPAWRAVLAVPFFFGAALIVAGLTGFVVAAVSYMRVVPW